MISTGILRWFIAAFYCLCTAVPSTSNAYTSDGIGRLAGQPNETIYLTRNADDSFVAFKLREARHMLRRTKQTNQETPGIYEENEKNAAQELENHQSAIKKLVSEKKAIGVPAGALVLYLDEDDPTLPADRQTWLVMVISGSMKGIVGWSPVYVPIYPEPGNGCFIFAHDGYKYAFGAFEAYTLEYFWDAIYKGDDYRVGLSLDARSIHPIKSGTRGYCEARDFHKLQIRITTGQHKGKLLWIYRDAVSTVDLKTLTIAIAESNKLKRSVDGTQKTTGNPVK